MTKKGKGSSCGVAPLPMRWPGPGHAATQVILATSVGNDGTAGDGGDDVIVPDVEEGDVVKAQAGASVPWVDDKLAMVRTAQYTKSPIVVYGGTVPSRTGAAWNLARIALADAAASARGADDVGACRVVVLDGFDDALTASTLTAALPPVWPSVDPLGLPVYRALVILHADSPRLLPMWDLLLSTVAACPLVVRILVVDHVDSAPLSTGAGHHELHYLRAPATSLPPIERAAARAMVERWDAASLVTTRSAVTTRMRHLRQVAMVLRSLTTKAVDAFAICVRAAAALNDHAISVAALADACRGSWVSGTVDNILNYSREWIDHNLVRVVRGSGANAVFQPTVAVNELDEVLPARR
jgi:hypothetical protein